MDLTLIAAFVVAATVLSLMPGPDMMFIAAHALLGGRRAGLAAAVGVSHGILVHTVAAAFGLGALIQAMPVALDVVRYCGAAFLVYLAVSAWRSSRRRGEGDHPDQADAGAVPEQPRSVWRVYLMGLLTNLANPKVVLFYLAFFPQFVTTADGAWPVTVQLLVLGATLMVVGLAVDGSVGLLAATVAARALRMRSFRRWLDRVCAVIFGGLAARLVVDAT